MKTVRLPVSVSWGELRNNFPLHSHTSDSEIIIVTDGEGVHVIDEIKYSLSKGDVFVVKGDVSHSFEIKQGKILTLVNIQFLQEYFNNFFSKLRGIPGFNVLFNIEPVCLRKYKLKSFLHLTEGMLNRVLGIVREIQNETRNFSLTSNINTGIFNFRRSTISMPGSSQYERSHFLCAELHHPLSPGAGVPENPNMETDAMAMSEALFYQLVIILSREYSRSIYSKDDFRWCIGEIISYIDKNYDKNLSLKQLAKISNMSVNNFLRIFKRVTGYSPCYYLNQIRIAHAKELLLSTDLSISEVSFASGFRDSNYFSRHFKRSTGLSPGEFRKGHFVNQ